MRVAIGVDHGGFPLKGPVVDYLTTAEHEVLDLGAYNMDPGDDYPDYAKAVGEAVLRGEAERGIIICGSKEFVMNFDSPGSKCYNYF